MIRIIFNSNYPTYYPSFFTPLSLIKDRFIYLFPHIYQKR